MPVELQEFIERLIIIAVQAAVPVLVVYVIMFIRAALDRIRSRLSNEQRWLIENVVNMVVKAAQQSGAKGLIEDTAAAKKEYAVRTVQQILDSKGLGNISAAEISAQIEAAILQGLHYPES